MAKELESIIINPSLIRFLCDLEIEWIAEMDFLLSPLCHSIEEEVYEVEPCVREVLLLEMENLYGEERAEEIKKEIAKFLWYYLQQKPEHKQRPEFRKTQEWIARAYLEPDRLIQRMRESLQLSFAEENSLLQLSKQIPVVKNLELLAEPLVKTQQKGDYQQLMREMRVVAHVLYGEEQITEIEKGIPLLSSPFFGWLKQSSKIEKQPSETPTEETVVTPPQPKIPVYLEEHFQQVIKAITEGKIIPFLGSEINLCDRPLQENGEPKEWQPRAEFPPTDSEIATYLLSEAAYLSDEGGLGDKFPGETLPQVAQFFELKFGRQRLETVLNTIYYANYRPNRLHRFLAKVLNRTFGIKLNANVFPEGTPYPLIVTTCYDRTLERAFQNELLPFDLVSYSSRTKEFIYERFDLQDGGEYILTTREILSEKKEPLTFLRQRPVILKLYETRFGAIDPNFVLTEDQFLNYLHRTNIDHLLPAKLTNKLDDDSIWFLGCSPNELKIKVGLNRIFSENRSSRYRQGFAIQSNPNVLDKTIWERANVDLIEFPLSDYVGELEKQLEETLMKLPRPRPSKPKRKREVGRSEEQPQIDLSQKTPFMGLNPYSEEDARFFFGRERYREIITGNLKASRLTILYGASGVGKSSILRAGVAYHLRQVAKQNLEERGTPEFAVVVFNSWHDDPIVGLKQQIDADIKSMLLDIQSPAPELSFVETLQAWTEILGGEEGRGRLFIILDQFEEYFLYHPQEESEAAFAVEFPRAVNNPELSVNFLISIREDALAKLDRFRGRIPNILDNRLSIQPLDLESAKEAILEPINAYNRLRGRSISIEPKLVEAVLEQVKESEGKIETPYLQLVMSYLWDAEMKAGSNHLRLETLKKPGNARGIVDQYIVRRMNSLSDQEQKGAAQIFKYLVTPSGTKIAHSASDLAGYTELDQTELRSLLAKFSALRILRPVVTSTEQSDTPRYEIFHDALAPVILNWRGQYLEKAETILRKSVGSLQTFRKETEK